MRTGTRTPPTSEALADRDAAACSSLGDVPLLAMLLAGGGPGDATQARDLAAAWLRDRGGWRATPGRPGADDPVGGLVAAALEVARRYHRADLEAGPGLTSPRQSAAYLQAELRDRRQEVFACLFLDTRHRVLAFEELFRGSIDGACVYPRVVAERALTLGAAAVIAAHNHPSGVAEPSLSDQAITHRLRDALALIDVRLLDHFVIGAGRPVSLAERGLV